MAAGSPVRLGMVLARLLVGAFAAAAFVWAVFVTPIFWSNEGIARAASHIIAGEIYNPETMDALNASFEHTQGAVFRSSLLNNGAIIQLRNAENAIAAGDPKTIDEKLTTLDRSVNDALDNGPSDPFLWLIGFWLSNKRDGYTPEHLRYLQMSYDLGPQEGWIAVKRNQLALGLYAVLSDKLKTAALSEFVGLTRSQLYDEAADIMIGATPTVREALLVRLAQLGQSDREAFAKVLNSKGAFDIAVPGVGLQPDRPWRRD